jgi:hypothetical protein
MREGRPVGRGRMMVVVGLAEGMGSVRVAARGSTEAKMRVDWVRKEKPESRVGVTKEVVWESEVEVASMTVVLSPVGKVMITVEVPLFRMSGTTVVVAGTSVTTGVSDVVTTGGSDVTGRMSVMMLTMMSWDVVVSVGAFVVSGGTTVVVVTSVVSGGTSVAVEEVTSVVCTGAKEVVEETSVRVSVGVEEVKSVVTGGRSTLVIGSTREEMMSGT